MNSRFFSLAFFVLVIGLVGFYLVTTTLSNPTGVLQNILIIIVIVAAFYLLYKLFTSSGSSKNPRASYNRAVKQSKKKYAKPKNVTSLNNRLKKASTDTKTKKGSSLLKKRKQTHLTVIEGKKGKKKNRASF
ncbi:SA1362 family protein [Microbacteriaceae bacterium 4G12]